MTESHRDPKQVLATLAERKLSLELSTLDLCFISWLRLKAERENIASFTEQHLLDAFEQVCVALHPDTENVKAKATHAIRRLREQRLMTRVDGAGILRAGEFSLTLLATQIVDFYVQSDPLTQESLTLLTRTLMLSLAEIANAAHAATSSADWQSRVVGPLRVTVNDLVSGIEGRQRSLDLEQEEFQRRVSELLAADWFGSLERCQELLETTASTLRELNEVLLRGTYELMSLLQDLLGVAHQANQPEAARAVNAVIEQVDRIGAWGAARQRAFSEYYDYVHRYLRDVVRFDPSRALTERLRKMLAGKAGRSYSLTVASAPTLRILREVKAPESPPPVRRPRQKDPEQPSAEPPAPDPAVVLEGQVRALLDAGMSDLGALTGHLTQGLAERERFVMAGRIAKVLAKLSRPLGGHERPWVRVDEQLAIEQWQVPNTRSSNG